MIKKAIKKFGRSRKSSGMHIYSNLSPRRQKKEVRTRRKAEYLASLPKNPAKRFFYRLHPRRVAKFWFSREGAFLALKIIGVFAVILAILVGGLFAYYRHELSSISPEELAKRVQTTVTRYYDRNNVLLWEDKGSGDYKLVVQSDAINNYMKQATVAIEDRNFYNEGGISPTGIIRAALNDVNGGSTQGASTLTQQLIKQVFFADQSQERGLGGVPRKIKEIILSIEADRMYNKDQILTMYLNESPYGGPRNGVESAAQDYFGKPAKDLTIPEAALLAAIPQSPGLYNPRNLDGNQALLARQHEVLDDMTQQKMITQQQADDAKKVAILNEIQPEKPNTAKAPYFIAMVQEQLKQRLGDAVVGKGGLNVVTTLDYRAQQIAETQMSALFASYAPRAGGFDNGAITVVDTKTSQVIALMGGRDYAYPGYGQVNETEAWLQQGSSVKPFVYSALMQQKSGTNYAPGSILTDVPLPQSIYATGDGQPLGDAGRSYAGNMHIRDALAQSRNVPAVEAMYLNDKVNGNRATIGTMQAMGDTSYCTNGPDQQVGLSAAFGGCGGKIYELANAYSTLGRLGVYKPVSFVLKVTNGQGQVVQQWQDNQAKQVVDPQIAYMINDILTDDNARAPLEGHNAPGFVIPGVKTATKTGTSDFENHAKDLWFNSYNPAISASMWLGNHDNSPLGSSYSAQLGITMAKIFGPIVKDIYQPDGNWKPGDWYTAPAGIQRLNINGSNDIYPSWYNKAQQQTTGDTVVFDSISKKKATSCTPARAKINETVQTYKDPITGKVTMTASDGYDPNSNDDVHSCTNPLFVNVSATKSGDGKSINMTATANDNDPAASLQTIEFMVNGNVVSTQSISGSSATATYSYTPTGPGTYAVTALVIDSKLYDYTSGSASATLTDAPIHKPSGQSIFTSSFNRSGRG